MGGGDMFGQSRKSRGNPFGDMGDMGGFFGGGMPGGVKFKFHRG